MAVGFWVSLDGILYILRFFAIGAFLISTLSVGAFTHAATKSEQDACERDVMRLCRKVIDQGDFTILACLKENRARVSRACNKVLIRYGQ